MNYSGIKETSDYEKLVNFFVENQLEFDGDEEVDTDILHCYEILTEDGQSLVGAAVLARREGRFIIDGIAVDNKYRFKKFGEKLLDRICNVVKDEYNGDEIYLVARAPGFFRKNGFTSIDPEYAPNFFECRYCEQYQESCFPEIMKKVIT